MKRRLLLATAATLLAMPAFAQTKWDLPAAYPATNFHTMFMLCLSLITFFFYAFFIKNEVENLGLFFIVLLLASTGLAGVLSLMSAIASKASGNFAMMSILSFPVMMPLILVVIRVSKQAVDGIEWAGVGFSFIVILAALNILTLALSFLLFPYLWRD